MRIAIAAILLLVVLPAQAKQASISGRVVNESGVPVDKGTVGLARYTYDWKGEPALLGMKTVKIDSRIPTLGEYRFDQLDPGEYFVYLELPTWYYPGTFDVRTASRITVAAGSETRLRDFVLSAVQTPLIRIHLVNATGDPEAPKGCVSVWRTQRGVPNSSNRFNTTQCARDGSTSIELRGLTPAIYDIHAGWSTPYANGPVDGGMVSIDVGSQDAEFTVVVSRTRLTGRIVTELPNGTLQPASGLDFSLEPAKAGPTVWLKTRDDGSFVYDRLGQGEYFFGVKLPDDAYIASLKQGDCDALQDGIEIRSVDVNLDGLISFAGGTLEGSSRPGGTVVLVPDAPLRRNWYLYRTATADQNGRFVMRGIAPGAYQVFAWSKLNGAAYMNADFMRNYETKGVPVVIGKGERVTAEVKPADALD